MLLQNNRFIRVFALLFLFAGAPLACSSQDGRFDATIIGYNHTSNPIQEFKLTVDQGKSADGLSLMPHSGGGSFVCCVPVRRKWHDRMNATVKFTELVQGKEREREVNVQIPRYDSNNMGNLNIHFLRGGDVKIFIGGNTLTSENYPLQGPEAELGDAK